MLKGNPVTTRFSKNKSADIRTTSTRNRPSAWNYPMAIIIFYHEMTSMDWNIEKVDLAILNIKTI